MSHRGLKVTKVRKEERRKQAEARQAEYDKLTLQEKLDRLPSGKCERQRVRYAARLEKQAQKQALAVEKVEKKAKSQ